MRKYVLILLCIFTSCNKTLLVPQGNIIRYQKGYILFYYPSEEALFFPWRDTIDQQFISHHHLNGYKLRESEKELEYIKDHLAGQQTITQYVLQNGQSTAVAEVVKLIPVNIKYTWGDAWKSRAKKGQKITIRYYFRDKDVELRYKLYDDRQIMSIIPATR
ncbi:hypothetical protein [Chitinophaga varians]|uniref:hypothetical protein n=1 Tax=Chitinophaga varians TaxID=2202339 RepID=UPI00166004B2|nr:hypothetical protein [Chitinophaga varians]MBC9911295.1 hypothetical protein [Chitinophaga varians]